MYIGQINTGKSPVRGQFAFYERGTQRALPPDIVQTACDRTAGYDFTSLGFEAGRPAGWKWDTLMDVGVDIRVTLSQPCMIGALEVTLAAGSAVRAAEAVIAHDGNERIVGRCDAASDGALCGTVTIPVGVTTRELTLRLYADLHDIVIERAGVIGAAEDGVAVYPTPRKSSVSVGALPLSKLGQIRTEHGCVHAAFAADYLRERMQEVHGRAVTTDDGQAAITLAVDSSLDPEEYRVRVSENGVELCAAARLPLLYAVETLLQLVHDGQISYADIEDAPYKPMRGFHFGLPPREMLSFARKVIRYVLIPMRYNQIIIEFAGGMRFDRHPEISEAWLAGNRAAKEGKQPPFPHGEMVAGGALLEKDEVRALVDYARDFGFDVIPEIQSFGHVQYITYAHPEIAERAADTQDTALDTRAADQPPSVYYDHSYCPQLEESYTLIGDIIDEIIEVVRPARYVHMGHDEIYQLAICPRCKGKDPAQLYVMHVQRMYDALQARGLGMMLWSDMLQPVMKYGTHPARSALPRDILMLDFVWYFNFDLDLEDNLLPFGYQVMMGNLYSSHYPRFETRMAKDGMLGGQVSTWCRFDEYNLAKKGKLFDLVYTAEMLWSAGYDARARAVYTRITDGWMRRIRPALRGYAVPVGVLPDSVPVALPAQARPSLPCALDAALRLHPDGVLDGLHFDLAGAQKLCTDGVSVPVGQAYSRLVFLHATQRNARRIAWKPLTQVGEYTVRYTDGTEVQIPVEYGGNICAYTRPYAKPLPQQYYRHQGYIATYLSDPLLQERDEEGRDVTALGYDWQNPFPEKMIASVFCRTSEDNDAQVLLLGISGIR